MKIVTHNSTYHADDVFAVAVMLMLYPEAEVVRTRDKEQIKQADCVVDVGFVHDPKVMRFDHHQPGGAGERANGIPYASFGLVWKEYGEQLAGGKREAEVMDGLLVQPLDAHDNGVAIAEYKYDNLVDYTLVGFVYSYLPKSRETEENLYKIFIQVVEVAKALIQREINKAREMVQAGDAARLAYEQSADKRIVVLEQDYGWQRVLMQTPEAAFVVYPRNDGNWSAKGVSVSSKKYGILRKNFPESWAAKEGEELQKLTGVADAIFAHQGLFMVAAKSKAGAIKLAEIALNQ